MRSDLLADESIVYSLSGAILRCAPTCLTGLETSIDIAQSCIARVHVQQMGCWFQLLDLLRLCAMNATKQVIADVMRCKKVQDGKTPGKDTTPTRPGVMVVAGSKPCTTTCPRTSYTFMASIYLI